MFTVLFGKHLASVQHCPRLGVSPPPAGSACHRLPSVAFFVGTIGLNLPRPRELERHGGQIAAYHPTCRSPNAPQSYGGCGEGAAPPYDQEPLSGVDSWGERVDRLVLEGQLPEQAFRVFRYGEYVDQSPANAGTGAMVIPDWQDISVYENFPEIGQWAAMDIDPEELATRPRNSQVPAGQPGSLRTGCGSMPASGLKCIGHGRTPDR